MCPHGMYALRYEPLCNKRGLEKGKVSRSIDLGMRSTAPKDLHSIFTSDASKWSALEVFAIHQFSIYTESYTQHLHRLDSPGRVHPSRPHTGNLHIMRDPHGRPPHTRLQGTGLSTPTRCRWHCTPPWPGTHRQTAAACCSRARNRRHARPRPSRPRTLPRRHMP